MNTLDVTMFLNVYCYYSILGPFSIKEEGGELNIMLKLYVYIVGTQSTSTT